MPPLGFASDLAMERHRRLQPHLEAGVPLARLTEPGGPSERTLRRWLACWRRSGVAGLERQARSDHGCRRRVAPELETMIRSEALAQPRPTAAAIHRRVCAIATQRGLAVPSYAVLTEIVRSVSPAMRAVATDPAAYRDRHELVHRREAAAPNETWQADHALLGVQVADARGTLRRPWLTVVIDDHSRAVAGYAISTAAPCAIQTALALRHAIWRKEDPGWPMCGIPERLYVDNGSDFTSEHVAQACAALKIQLVHSWPGRPRGRGRIERFFRTVRDMLEPELPGRIVGGQGSGTSASAPALDLHGLGQRFEAFLRDVYHPRRHGGTGEAPLARWQAGGFLPNMPDSLEALDLLLMRVAKPRKVLRDGIRLGGRRYIEPTLAAFVGEMVEVLHDPRDLAEVRVYHQGAFVCRALSPEHVAAPGLDDIQAARRAARLAHVRGVRGEALAGTDDAPASRPPARRHGLKLYADED